MENVFDTKEQAVAFKSKWKAMYKEGFHKPKKHPIHQYKVDGVTRKWEDVIVGYYQASDLDAAFHLMYAVALGRDLQRGFGKARRWKMGNRWHYPIHSGSAIKPTFEVFGDLLTEEQKKKITAGMELFINGLCV